MYFVTMALLHMLRINRQQDLLFVLSVLSRGVLAHPVVVVRVALVSMIYPNIAHNSPQNDRIGLGDA